MEPITTSKTTTKINTQQIYPQPRKSRVVAESSSSSGSGSSREIAIGSIEEREENGSLVESGDNLPISSTEEDNIDEFLIVSLRASRSSPSRLKNVSYLYMIALLDLGIITVCTILSVHEDKQGYWHWRKAAFALGLVRFIVVVGVASSKWIRELRWILGGVCCVSFLFFF
jgi:hypothetical protein